MSFVDRAEAGRRLADALKIYADADPVVIALPRGGVIVAAPVAQALHAPLDLAPVRKLSTPSDPEVAIGALADRGRPIVVWNRWALRAMHPSQAVRDAALERETAELHRRAALYMQGRRPVSVRGRTAIVIDDGLATGATMEAALQAVRLEQPRRLVLAVPVAPADTLERLAADVDAAVCLETPDHFIGVGRHYQDFRQVTDAEVIATLAAAPGAEDLKPPA